MENVKTDEHICESYLSAKKQARKEPLMYLAQIINVLHMGLNIAAKIVIISPIVYFWVIVASMSTGTEFPIPYTEILDFEVLKPFIFITSMFYVIVAILSPYRFGFKNIFFMRTSRILERQARKEASQ